MSDYELSKVDEDIFCSVFRKVSTYKKTKPEWENEPDVEVFCFHAMHIVEEIENEYIQEHSATERFDALSKLSGWVSHELSEVSADLFMQVLLLQLSKRANEHIKDKHLKISLAVAKEQRKKIDFDEQLRQLHEERDDLKSKIRSNQTKVQHSKLNKVRKSVVEEYKSCKSEYKSKADFVRVNYPIWRRKYKKDMESRHDEPVTERTIRDSWLKGL